MTSVLREAGRGGLPVWESPRLADLGVPHVFTGRLGGLSVPPFDQLNLGDHVGDDPAAVAANRARLAAALGANETRIRWLRQIHEASIVTAADEPWPEPPAADAALCSTPGVWVGVQTADCLPVLLASPDGRAVAAVHAGWRGLCAEVLPTAALALARLAGCPPSRLVGAIGPAIGVDRYEVSRDVSRHFPPEVVAASPAGLRLDVTAAALRQLASLEIDQVDIAGVCTSADRERCFSYRRDGVTGRQAGLITPRPA